MKIPFLLLLVWFLLTGCAQVTVEPTPTASASNSPTQQACWLSPLTGQCGVEDAPVIVAKIDDVAGARPQRGLNDADVVIVEPVEGGLTRLAAVFHSGDPGVIGPIRSARITDIDLAQAFGLPGFAYSGATTRLRPVLASAPVQLIGAPQGATGYFRVDTHAAPHNLMANFANIRARIRDLESAKLTVTQSWSFDADATAGVPVQQVSVRWPSSTKRFTWDAAENKFRAKVFDDKLMTTTCCQTKLSHVTMRTVLIMKTDELPNPYGSSTGARTPYPRTTGEGSGYVFTRGRMIEATWKRTTVNDLPQWFDSQGSPISFAPGRVWWLIATDSTSIDVTYPAPSTPSPAASTE